MPRRKSLDLPAVGTKAAPKSPKKKPAAKKITPMMEQFLAAKREQPGALVFFRMGDFYELFGDDAVTAGRELGITVTSRDKGKGADAMPMAGVPVKAYESYLMRLVAKGFKVAICEQLTDPKAGKGIVQRGIVRVVTPGTLTEENALDAKANNYLAALHVEGEHAALAWVDLSTARFQSTELPLARVADELARLHPAELLCAPTQAETHPVWAEIAAQLGPRITEREDWRFERRAARKTLEKQLAVGTLAGFGIEDDSPIVPAAGCLLEYLLETQRGAISHLRRIERVDSSELLVLDRATRSCLELTETQRGARREGSLLAVIDGTLTPMGARLLRTWLLSPLRRTDAILHRQQGVAELVDAPFLREDVRELLRDVLDLERLVAKISTGRANGRDLVALAASLEQVPPLREKLKDVHSSVLAELCDALDPLNELVSRIRTTVVDAPPMTIKEGGVVQTGVSAELDELRQIAGDGKSWMARFQAEEAEKTGISGLKIGFNSVFGYYIEIPRAQVDRAPENYVRKQTVKTAERYITPELKEFEGKVLKAEDRSKELEYEIFCSLRDAAAEQAPNVLETAGALAHVDVIAGLAQIAADQRYVAPEIDEGDAIEIVDGRHPVIELSDTCDTFVPNDAKLDDEASLTILTGPNMAGKSTYIRQVALITLLAQIGSFVPAGEARIGVVDRIFTRVGSGDDISRGESTFMVEMVEIANILNNASKRSLVILDEVGRGTSTFDGLSLAWAIAEHLRTKIGCRTLFATHYHQLTDLAGRLGGVSNRNVAVREWGDEIVFLHKIVEGGTDRSYGIQVARLAGVPDELIARAKEILHDVEAEEDDLVERIASHPGGASLAADAPAPAASSPGQLDLFAHAPSAVERELAQLDTDQLTPIDALLTLKRLREMLG